MERLYITTPIYYPNAPPHIGHAYTTVYADVLARYNRLVGRKVFFLTGNDEHGLKIQRAAEKEGITPKEFVDKMAGVYRQYWVMLNISYDHFIRTTDGYHEKVVSEAFKRLHEKGLIYKAKYAGWYCVDCERYYSPGEYVLVDDKPHCPIHNKPLEWLEEETYYFKLSEFKDYVTKTLSETDIVYPPSYAKEVLNRVQAEGLRDVSVARPKDRVAWGIPVPFDPDYTIYVWFDALLNYVSGIGYMTDEVRFQGYWPWAHHVIGKDILWFHTVVWFSLLKALDIPPPRRLIVHSFLINRGLKIGKSAGNVIPIEFLVERYNGSDGARYVLMKLFNLDKDVEVTIDLMDSIYNSELADTYGNLVRRVGVLAAKKVKGKVYRRDVDKKIEESIETALGRYVEDMESLEVSRALSEVQELGKALNTYINEVKPWEKSDPSKELYSLLEGIRAVTVMLSPVTPRASTVISESFGFKLVSPRDFRVGSVERYNIVEAPILFRKVQARRESPSGGESPPSG
ncbi:methionine--tRNA ligase [Thermogladius sp. KZ2Tp1]|uniref:methionine--tRNA ligase n=1 Tax=Thermogladius sp. KZ2Tp1 TaxID=3136289 RepID=UPI003DA88894